MSDEIRADYEQLELLARRFGQSSSQVGQMLASVRRSLDPLQNGGWIGRGSDAFFAEMNDVVLPASQRLQQALEEASEVTAKIGQNLQQAEEEASAPFKSSSV